MITLHAMNDADFAWLLGEGQARADTLSLCEGGIAPDEVTAMLRGVAGSIAETTDRPAAWMVSSNDQVVGMISFTNAGVDGRYEIGYGMAPIHQGRGVMTRAIAELLPQLRADGHDHLTAKTSVDNPGSQRVLEKNGFVRTGTHDDPEDGALIAWAINLTSNGRPA